MNPPEDDFFSAGKPCDTRVLSADGPGYDSSLYPPGIIPPRPRRLQTAVASINGNNYLVDNRLMEQCFMGTLRRLEANRMDTEDREKEREECETC